MRAAPCTATDRAPQERVNNEMNAASEGISRTRARIVQSPERIKRSISTMGSAAAEDKRAVAANEAKTRDLQTKITALLNIEKDVRSCVEQLQTIEKVMRALDGAQKELGDLRDTLDRKKGERAELWELSVQVVQLDVRRAQFLERSCVSLDNWYGVV